MSWRGARADSLWVGPQIFAGVLVLALVGALAIGPTRQLIEQRRRVAETAQALQHARNQTKRLDTRIERLNDPDFLEQRARESLGLVRPGEQAYIVMPRSKASERGEGRKAPQKAHRTETRRPLDQPSLLGEFLTFIGVS